MPGRPVSIGPAGLGLPVVVDDRDAELVGDPLVRGFVERLAGEEQVRAATTGRIS
jgi:hypothetical protein